MEYRLKNCQVGQTRLVLVIAVAFLLWACSSLRPFFENDKFREQLKTPLPTPA